MRKEEREETLNYLSEAFDGCRVVIWDGDVWLLNEDKTYMFAIGTGRIGRPIDSGAHGGDITLNDLEDVIDMYRRLILERLSDV